MKRDGSGETSVSYFFMIEYANFIEASKKKLPFQSADKYLGGIVNENYSYFMKEFPQLFDGSWNPIVDTKKVRSSARQQFMHTSELCHILDIITGKVHQNNIDFDKLGYFFCETSEHTCVLRVIDKLKEATIGLSRSHIEKIVVSELLGLNGVSIMKLATQKIKGIEMNG